MKKTLLTAAILAASFSTATLASQTGEAMANYPGGDSFTAIPDTVFDTIADGQAAAIDSRIATVVAIPGALVDCTAPDCGQSVITTAATDITDPSDIGGEASANPLEPGEADEAPLSITGSVAAAQDACSVQMPASVDFTFDVSRAEIDGVTTGSPKTFDSEETVSVNFECGEDRSDNLVVSFSTVDDETNKSSSVDATFTSNYHATPGVETTLLTSVLFSDDSDAAADKTLTADASQSVSLKAQVTLDDNQAKGGSFETSDATLYVYIN